MPGLHIHIQSNPLLKVTLASKATPCSDLGMCYSSEGKQHHIEKMRSDFLSTFDANKSELRIMLGCDTIHSVLYELVSKSCSIGRRTERVRKTRCVLSCDISLISISHLASNDWLNYMESFTILITS